VVINQQSSKNKDGYYYSDYHAVEEKIVNSPGRRGSRNAGTVTPKIEQSTTAD
jgi:hypothetical protein